MYRKNEVIENRYKILDVLMGGMGIVYVCNDLLEERIIAIKTIQEHLFATTRGIDSFIQEANLWVQLGEHPNIVHAYEVKLIEGRPGIFMEYIPGENKYGSSLRGLVLQGKIPLNDVLHIAIQICEGMAYAQKRFPGLVHKDLKPENILFSTNGIAKVSDFGLAGQIENNTQDINLDDDIEFFQTNITKSGKIIGSPPYMSPEQWFGKDLDFRSDIYSIGCIIYELLTQNWIVYNRIEEWKDFHIKKHPPKIRSRIFDIPTSMVRIIDVCLEKNPNDRYQTFQDLSNELQKVYYEIQGSEYNLPNVNRNSTLETQINISRSLLILGDSERAVDILQPLLEKHDQNYEILGMLGRGKLDQKKFSEAKFYLEKSLEIKNDNDKVLSNFGLLHILTNNYEDAIACFEKAIEIGGVTWVAWNNLGIAYQLMDELEKAIDCFDKSISITPWQSEAWTNKANVLKKLGNTKESAACNKFAIKFSISHERRAEIALQLMDSDISFVNDDLFEIAEKSTKKHLYDSIKLDFIRNRIQSGENEKIFRAFFSSEEEPIVEHLALVPLLQIKGYWIIKKYQNNENITNDIQEAIDIISNFYKAESPKNDIINFLSLSLFMILLNVIPSAAIKILEASSTLSPLNSISKFFMGYAYFETKKYSEARSYFPNKPDPVIFQLGLSESDYKQFIDLLDTLIN
ncbi:protein kinase [bacterium]|nr:protein kinase [bacterium]